MAKRIAILSGILFTALLAGLLGANLLGGPFTSRASVDDGPVTERYALGRDVYRQEDYAVDTKYAPYHPGENRIASPTVNGARKLDPYQAARPDHRIAFDSEDGNFMEATGLPGGDYAIIDPPRHRTKPAPNTPKADEKGPENLLPGDYVRTERPADRQAETPAVSPAPAPSADPVSDTERRIMGIANARTGRREGGNDAPSENIGAPTGSWPR